jgi:membrane protease YdiL (CAAX protease family)
MQSKAKKAAYFTLILFFIMFLFSVAAEGIYYAYLLATGVSAQGAYQLLQSNTAMLEYVLTAAASFSFSAAALLYLRFVDKSRKPLSVRLGLSASRLTFRNIGLGLLLFAVILAFEALVSAASGAAGVSIQTNVNLLLTGAPAWFLIFTVFLAPINEEVLFRGLMVPRIGIVASAILFALPHITYDSTFAIEVIAALLFGVLAGYVYRKTGSLYASITAHMLVNALPVLALLLLSV